MENARLEKNMKKIILKKGINEDKLDHLDNDYIEITKIVSYMQNQGLISDKEFNRLKKELS